MKSHRKTHSRILENFNLKRAWQLSHNIENCEPICIVKGCEDLKSYIISNSRSCKKRFSIGTSSKILAGLARAYSNQIDILYRDMFNISCYKKNVVDATENSDKPIPYSSSNADYHNKSMNMSLEISSIIDYEIITDGNEVSDKESIENDIDQESINEIQLNNTQISSKHTYNSHQVYKNIRKNEKPVVIDEDDSSDDDDRSNGDDSSRVEPESSSENEYTDIELSSDNITHRLTTIPEDSENVTSLHETKVMFFLHGLPLRLLKPVISVEDKVVSSVTVEGNQDIGENDADEINMPTSPIIPTIIVQIEQKEISYEKSPIVSWPTSQEFNNTKHNDIAMPLKTHTLQIPTNLNTLNETLASGLLQSPIILTKLQDNPSKRKFFDVEHDGKDTSENEKKAKKDTEESSSNEHFEIDQEKSPIIPYTTQTTDNQNNKSNLENILYKDNATQTENNYVHLGNEEVNKSDISDVKSDKHGIPVCSVFVYDSKTKAPIYLINSKVNPEIMETLNGLADTSM